MEEHMQRREWKEGVGGVTYPPDAHAPVVKLVLRLAEETLQAGQRTTWKDYVRLRPLLLPQIMTSLLPSCFTVHIPTSTCHTY